jgi:putative membrane protein
MEDIPPEVSSALRKGISDMNELVLIDSHNSIDEMPTMTPQDSYDLVTSGRTALQQAASAKQGPLRVGATKITLREFSLDQGIGPCGLSVIAVETGRQLSVYLTIDGNNMKKGLREHILESAKQAGVNEAEVMTTDSHMVSGRISSRLGYHPVGEAIDNNVLLSRIRSAIGDALIGLEESQAEWNSGNVLVRTLGRRAFENLTTLVQGMSRLATLGFLGIVAVPLLLGLILLH